MDSHLRSPPGVQVRSGGTNVTSRASRILQKVTGRIRFHSTIHKPTVESQDDHHPYPSQATARLSGASVKPYMSHPMLSNTLVDPYGTGDEQDSSSHSGSPPDSVFRRPMDQNMYGTPIRTSFAANPTTTPQVIDGLPITVSHHTPPVWSHNDTLRARPPRPTRPTPELPIAAKHRPSTTTSDSAGSTVSSEGKTQEQSKFSEEISQPRLPMTSIKPAKIDTTSNFSPARLFTRKASRPQLKDLEGHNLDEPPLPPPLPVPSKHRPTPSIVISGAIDPPLDPPKRPKPARIDTGLSPVRLFTRKASRTHLNDQAYKRMSDDPPTPFTLSQPGSFRPPSPPPPLPPKTFSTHSVTPPRSGSVATTSPTSPSTSTSTYHTSSPTVTTTPATSPAAHTTHALPEPKKPPRLTTSASTSVVPISPGQGSPPPILQRSETAPYRLSLRLSTTFPRPPPLPIQNLPTLPPPSPLVSTPSRRIGLRDVPELPHDGRRSELDDGDDELLDADEEDDEGRISRTSTRGSPLTEQDDDDGDDDRPRPSMSSSIGSFALSVDTSASSLGVPGKTHSRSSSYAHHPSAYSIDESAPTSFSSSSITHSHSHSKKNSNRQSFKLPRPDTSSLDLDFSFLDASPSPPLSSSLDRKGKGRARPEEDDEFERQEQEQGLKTPTSSDFGAYLDSGPGYGSLKPVTLRAAPMPKGKESLKVWTSPDVLRARDGERKEMDTAKPKPKTQHAVPMQVSVSTGPYVGLGVGATEVKGLERGGLYASKRMSRSLMDLGALARKEEIVREEEEKERRRSRLSRIQGSGSGETVVVSKSEGEGWDTRMLNALGKSPSDVTVNVNAETTSPGMDTPAASSTKRFSLAPAYDIAIRPSPSLHRRRSMPMFTESSEPPPYPDFPPLSPSNIHTAAPFNSNTGPIEPRDDEGRERLPPYSNAVYLRATLPRKMEFTSPGVQAKDRKWRRIVCVVEGTSLRVYKPPRERGGRGALGEWWERRVGAGDASVFSGPGTSVKKDEEGRAGGEGERERVPKLVGESSDAGQTELVLRPPSTPTTPITPARTQPVLTGEHPFVPGQPPPHSIYGSQPPPQANRSRLNLAVSNLLGKSHNRKNSDAPVPSLNLPNSHPDSPRSSLHISAGGSGTSVGHGGRGSFSRPQTPSNFSHSAGNPSLTSAASVRSRASSVASAHGVDDPRDLLRSYTMQHAESGLGNDYIKRKHVIRVRVEGEQFLLQAKDVADVVAWIEVLQTSANIALDLDERPMPKGPLFPRRRRRRPRPVAQTGASSTGTGTSAAQNDSNSQNRGT
ncbi:hypothetical protein H0H92_011332 [Tricholoma furcatifolium]|nr:hypothetical protein H0H92_011332 [Tricholoma furcatifolium]